MTPRILDRDIEDTRQPSEDGCEDDCEEDVEEFEYDMEDE